MYDKDSRRLVRELRKDLGMCSYCGGRGVEKGCPHCNNTGRESGKPLEQELATHKVISRAPPLDPKEEIEKLS